MPRSMENRSTAVKQVVLRKLLSHRRATTRHLTTSNVRHEEGCARIPGFVAAGFSPASYDRKYSRRRHLGAYRWRNRGTDSRTGGIEDGTWMLDRRRKKSYQLSPSRFAFRPWESKWKLQQQENDRSY
jgi:hypothetical protein